MQGMFGKVKVWNNTLEIANIISLKTIKSMFRVTYDSKDRGGVFTVQMEKGKTEFIPHPKGLRYLDLEKFDDLQMLMAITVEENHEGCTKHDVRKAKEAWRLLNMMGGHESQSDKKLSS